MSVFPHSGMMGYLFYIYFILSHLILDRGKERERIVCIRCCAEKDPPPPAQVCTALQSPHSESLSEVLTPPPNLPGPAPALPPATIQPESPPGILPLSPCSLSFKKLRPSAERSGHQTGSLQGTFPSGKTVPQTTEPPGQEVGVRDGRGSSDQLSEVKKAGRTSHPEKQDGIFSRELSRGLPFTETGTICPPHTPSPTGLLQHCSLSL